MRNLHNIKFTSDIPPEYRAFAFHIQNIYRNNIRYRWNSITQEFEINGYGKWKIINYKVIYPVMLFEKYPQFWNTDEIPSNMEVL